MTIADVNAETRTLCDADSTSLPDAVLLRRVNAALETCVAKIVTADGTWQFDDTNYTTLPIATGNLVAGQVSYTFSSDFLELEEVDILDLGGIYRRITPFDPEETGMSFEEFTGTTTSATPNGFPQYYDKQGDSIRLSNAPQSTNCTLTNGIKIRFKRTGDVFTAGQVTTGTKEPGIASPYHMLICYMMAVPYCMSYKKDRVPLYEKKIDEMTRDMLKFYAHREQDKRKVITMSQINYR